MIESEGETAQVWCNEMNQAPLNMFGQVHLSTGSEFDITDGPVYQCGIAALEFLLSFQVRSHTPEH